MRGPCAVRVPRSWRAWGLTSCCVGGHWRHRQAAPDTGCWRPADRCSCVEAGPCCGRPGPGAPRRDRPGGINEGLAMRQPRLLLLALLALTVVVGSLMNSSAARGLPARWCIRPQAPPGRWGAPRHAPTTSNVTYHGGPVIAGEMQVYAIFWEPSGSFVSSKFNMLLKRYFRDVGGSGLYANNGQYTDSSGQAPTGAELAGHLWIDRPIQRPPCSRTPTYRTKSRTR